MPEKAGSLIGECPTKRHTPEECVVECNMQSEKRSDKKYMKLIQNDVKTALHFNVKLRNQQTNSRAK